MTITRLYNIPLVVVYVVAVMAFFLALGLRLYG